MKIKLNWQFHIHYGNHCCIWRMLNINISLIYDLCAIHNPVTDTYAGGIDPLTLPICHLLCWDVLGCKTRDLSKFSCSTSYLYFITIRGQTDKSYKSYIWYLFIKVPAKWLLLNEYLPWNMKGITEIYWGLPVDLLCSHMIYLRVIFTARFHTWFRQHSLRKIATFAISLWSRSSVIGCRIQLLSSKNDRSLSGISPVCSQETRHFAQWPVSWKETHNIKSTARISYFGSCKQSPCQLTNVHEVNSWKSYVFWLQRQELIWEWFQLHYFIPSPRKMMLQKVKWKEPRG